MNVEIWDRVESVEAHQSEWERLNCSLPEASVFSTPAWHLAWLRSLGAGRRLVFLAARNESGALVAVLPLTAFRGSARDGFARCLEFSGSTQADVHDLIVATEDAKAVLDSMRPTAQGLIEATDVVRLTGVPTDSPLLEWAPLVRRSASRTVDTLPYVTIAGSYQTIAQGWRKSHRQDVGRQTRRLESVGALTLRAIEDQQDARAVLPHFLEMHTLNWSGMDFSIESKNRSIQSFFDSLINEETSWKLVHFSALELDGKPISYHFGFLFQDRFYWYKPAYDREFENYSPGKVHIAKLLESGVEHEWRIFDLLKGAEPYKESWADGSRTTVDVVFRNAGILSAVNAATAVANGVVRSFMHTLMRALPRRIGR